MAAQSMLAGVDLSSIPDAPKPKSLLSDLDLSSVPDARKPKSLLDDLDLSSIPDAPKQPELSPDQVIPDFGEQSGYRRAPFKVPPIPPNLLRENAQGILFPNVAAGSPPQATATPAVVPPPAEISTLYDRDASPAQTPGSPEADAIKNQPPYNRNTGKDPNADANVLDSDGKLGPTVFQEGSDNRGEATSDDHATPVPRVDIYVYPRKDKGYDFVAINSSSPKVVQGQFNTTTTNWTTDSVRPGDYTISYRPHIEVKSGIAGIEQKIGAVMSGNRSGDVNEHEGNLALSNTTDWNTIKYEDGTMLGGIMIHPGRDKSTGEGGGSRGCFVTNKPTYDQLDKMVLENCNHDGQTYFHLQPR